jgi:hypothetical protein
MRYLPQDPYSDSILVYRIVGDDFKLYSLGEDFEDNNGDAVKEVGILNMWGVRLSMYQHPQPMFVDLLKITPYKDIIYWPRNKRNLLEAEKEFREGKDPEDTSPASEEYFQRNR